SLWAMVLDLQVQGGVHIHRHGLDPATGLRPQPLKEGPHRGPTTTFAHPKHLLGVSVYRHAGVSMAFEQGKLIHDHATNPSLVRLRHVPLEAWLITGLDRMPVQAQ